MSTYRDCLVCGKSFKVCNTCNKNTDEMFQWRRVVCCPEHFQYHLPIIRFVRNQIDKETAKNELRSVIERYGEIEFCNDVKNIVGEILSEPIAEDVPVKQKTKKK